jgi:anti-sigma B factor antagonist
MAAAPLATSPEPAVPPAGTAAVTLHVVGRRTVVRVAGEIDTATAPALRAAIDAALEHGALELWIDLTPTTFMDSSGLHALIDAQARAFELNRRLAVICPGGCVRRVFDLVGLSGRLSLYDDCAAAHRGS